MQQKIKWTFIGVATLAIVLLLAMLAAAAFVDSGWTRQYLIRRIALATGRHWTADTLRLRLTTHLRIDATGLRISNADWALADHPDFLRAQTARLDVSLLPLLAGGRLHLQEVELDDTQLFLARKGQLNNWTLKNDEQAGDAVAPSAADRRQRALALLPDRLLIRQLDVTAALQDGDAAAPPQHWQVPSLSMGASNGRKVAIDATLRLPDGVTAPLVSATAGKTATAAAPSALSFSLPSPPLLIRLRLDDLNHYGATDAHTPFSLQLRMTPPTVVGNVDATTAKKVDASNKVTISEKAHESGKAAMTETAAGSDILELHGELPLDPAHGMRGADVRVHADFSAGSPLPGLLMEIQKSLRNTRQNDRRDGALNGTAAAAQNKQNKQNKQKKQQDRQPAGEPSRPLAALRLDATVREHNGSIDIGQLVFVLGGLRVTGDGTLQRQPQPASQTVQSQTRVEMPQPLPWHLDARLRTDYLDWAQAMLDAGRPPVVPKPYGDLFRDQPLAWPLLRKVEGFTANLDLQLALLKLRSGLPLQNVKLTMLLSPDTMRVPSFATDFMGGTVTAQALFIAHNQHVTLNLKATNVSIEAWRQALRKKKVLSGGPLAVDAQVDASGASMQELASHLNGPVNLRMGHAIVESQRAGEAETIFTGLVPALTGKVGGRAAERMEVVCAVASMPFRDGRAAARAIAGARTVTSQLLTDGEVDLRAQTLDLHGHVKGADGIRLGASMFVGDVNISGKLGKPHFRLDAQGVLGTAARIGAAILTGGLSVVGTTLWDASADDACKQPPAVVDRHMVGERALP